MLLSRIITIIFDAVMAVIIVKYTKQPHRLWLQKTENTVADV